MMLASAASNDMDLMALPPRCSSCILAKDQGGCGQTACSQSECSALRHCFHSPVCTHPDAHLDERMLPGLTRRLGPGHWQILVLASSESRSAIATNLSQMASTNSKPRFVD